MSSGGLKWTGGAVAGAAVGGFVMYLATLGWEKAGWVAGVVSMFLTAVGLGLAVAGEMRARRAVSLGGEEPPVAVPASHPRPDPGVASPSTGSAEAARTMHAEASGHGSIYQAGRDLNIGPRGDADPEPPR